MLIYLNLSPIIVVNVDEFYKTSSLLANTDESGKFDTQASWECSRNLIMKTVYIVTKEMINCNFICLKVTVTHFLKYSLFLNVEKPVFALLNLYLAFYSCY